MRSMDIGMAVPTDELPVAGPMDLAMIARRMIAARRALDGCLPPNFIPDPSVDMLMALFVAQSEGRSLTALELERRTTVSPNVAQRWIAALSIEGFVSSAGGIVTLTAHGNTRIEKALRAVLNSQLSIV